MRDGSSRASHSRFAPMISVDRMKALAWLLGIGAALSLSYGVLLAQSTGDPVPAAPGWMGWIGFSGLLAIGGLLIQWGSWKSQMAQTTSKLAELSDDVGKAIPRAEVIPLLHRVEDQQERRFDRIDDKIDALYGLLNVERRDGTRGGP